MPKMGIGDVLFFDRQLLKELVQEPRLLYLIPLPSVNPTLPPTSELLCSSLTLAVYCVGDKSRIVRKHFSLLGGLESQT